MRNCPTLLLMRTCPALLLMVVLTLSSCRTTAPPDYQHVSIDTTEARAAAALGVGDVFEVRVHGHDDLTGVHRVSTSGTIDFPLVGRVDISGLPPSGISDRIRDLLKDGYLVSPSVTIYVREYHSKKIFVLGQVRKPGMFNYEERMTIVQAIAMAGGFTGLARANYAIVTRVTDGAERRIPVPVEQIVTSQDSSNFALQPGDIVFVPEAVL